MKLLRRSFYGTVFMIIMYKLQQLAQVDSENTMMFIGAFALFTSAFLIVYGIGSVIDRYIRREL